VVNKKTMGPQGKEAVECRGSPLANAKEFSLQDQKKKILFPKSEQYPVTAI
jgi:hypothetical protein